MLEWISFIVGTILLAYFSRASLRSPGSHGFFRFIAWEWLLVLVVYNLDGWNDAPPSIDQTTSGILMGISLLLVTTSYLTLRLFGKADINRNDARLLVFEKTTILVNIGIYHYIRHPMYSSLIFLGWGLFFKQTSWQSAGAASVATFFLILASLAEEQESLRYFGDKYRDYMKRSKRYIPFLI